MPQQLKIEAGNILRATGLSVEPDVPSEKGRITVIRLQFEDLEAVVHQASFGVRPNHADGVVKSFKRMAPVVPKPAEEMVKSRRGEDGKEVGDAAGEGTRLDPPTGDDGGERTGKSDEMGAGVPGRAPDEIPDPAGDDVR